MPDLLSFSLQRKPFMKCQQTLACKKMLREPWQKTLLLKRLLDVKRENWISLQMVILGEKWTYFLARSMLHKPIEFKYKR